MKRMISIIAAVTLFFTLAGCENEKGEGKSSGSASLYDKGIEVISLMGEMAESEGYAELYSQSSEISDLASEIAEGDYKAPTHVYEISYSAEVHLPMDKLGGVSDDLKKHLEAKTDSALAAQINARESADAVAAGSIFTADALFVADENAESCIYLYTYGDAYPVMISFTAGEDGAVFAKGTYIFNRELKTDSEKDINEVLSTYKASVKKNLK